MFGAERSEVESSARKREMEEGWTLKSSERCFLEDNRYANQFALGRFMDEEQE